MILLLPEDLLRRIFADHLTSLRKWHCACQLAIGNKHLYNIALQELRRRNVLFSLTNTQSTVNPGVATLRAAARTRRSLKPCAVLKFKIESIEVCIGLELAYLLKYLERPQGWRDVLDDQEPQPYFQVNDENECRIKTTHVLLFDDCVEQPAPAKPPTVCAEYKIIDGPPLPRHHFLYTEDVVQLTIDLDGFQHLVGQDWPFSQFDFDTKAVRAATGFDQSSPDPEQKELCRRLLHIPDARPPPHQDDIRYQGRRVVPRRRRCVEASSGKRRVMRRFGAVED